MLKANRQEQLSYRYNLIFNRQEKNRKKLLAGINVDFGVAWSRKAKVLSRKFFEKCLGIEF